VLRLVPGRPAAPAAALCPGRPRQAPPARGPRAGDDGAQRRRGAQGPRAGETWGHLWALHVTAANAPDRRPGAPLASHGYEGPGEAVAGALVEQGSTGEHAAQDAQDQPRRLGVVKLPE